MLKLTYAENDVLISNEAGDALLEYAKALTSRGLSDSVELSVLDRNNEIVMAHLLVGPASQIVTLEAHGDSDMNDAAQVKTIRARTAALYPRPLVEPAGEPNPVDYDL